MCLLIFLNFGFNFFSGKNVLRIDGSNGPEEISFLGESELPNNAKQHNAEEADGKMET